MGTNYFRCRSPGYAEPAPGGDKSVAAGSRVPLPLEALEQGQTGDALWNDCQRCLAQAGELHNNARMAWGKTAVTWHAAPLLLLHHAAHNDAARRSPPAGECAEAAEQPGAPPSFSASDRLQAALELLIRLNDKFALQLQKAEARGDELRAPLGSGALLGGRVVDWLGNALDGGAPPSYGVSEPPISTSAIGVMFMCTACLHLPM